MIRWRTRDTAADMGKFAVYICHFEFFATQQSNRKRRAQYTDQRLLIYYLVPCF
jgi:hypothetical protein